MQFQEIKSSYLRNSIGGVHVQNKMNQIQNAISAVIIDSTIQKRGYHRVKVPNTSKPLLSLKLKKGFI